MLEDFDMQSMMESGGPVVSKVISIWRGILNARGADGDIGRKMESIIRSSGEYSEINTHKIPIPICNNGSGQIFSALLGSLH